MSRKIIIPKGLVENTNQASIIEVSPRLNQTTGNLIARRQGDRLVAQQLPDWQDPLSTPQGNRDLQNTFVATPLGCKPDETFHTAKSTFSRPADATYTYSQKTGDNISHSQNTTGRTEYVSALSNKSGIEHSKSCYNTPLAETPSGAEFNVSSNEFNLNSTSKSNIQMTDAMIASILNNTRQRLTAPKGNIDDVRRALFSDSSSNSGTPTPQANQTFSIPMNKTYNQPGIVHARTPCKGQEKIFPHANRRLFTSPEDSSQSPHRQMPHETFKDSKSSGYSSLRGQSESHKRQCPCSPDESMYAGFQPRLSSTQIDQTDNIAFSTETRPSDQTYVRPQAAATPPNRTFTCPGNQTFSRPQPAAHQTFIRPQAGNITQTVHRPNQTFIRAQTVPNVTTGVAACPGSAGKNETYSEIFSQSNGYRTPPSSIRTFPRAAGRGDRSRPGHDTYPISANRRVIDLSYQSSSLLDPSECLVESIQDYPTDESYEQRFQPLLSSTQRSLSSLQDSSELMLGCGAPITRSQDGKYNIITPMTPSPGRSPRNAPNLTRNLGPVGTVGHKTFAVNPSQKYRGQSPHAAPRPDVTKNVHPANCPCSSGEHGSFSHSPPRPINITRNYGPAVCPANQTFHATKEHETYSKSFSESSGHTTLPSSVHSFPRAAGRAPRPRHGYDTYPRSANRSVFETSPESDYWPDTSESYRDSIPDYPTDESYEQRFQPFFSSTQRSLSSLQDSSELMLGCGAPVTRSQDGKYNIITPMTPSPNKSKVDDCSCAPAGADSIVSYSSHIVEDEYAEN